MQLYEHGDTVYTKFVAANPRNNIMHEQSYFYVEQKQVTGNWSVVATDADWETKCVMILNLC
jgi:neutral ceramidase